jgi:hypothetical protein
MAIPEELFPEFCRRISAAGTWEREKLAKDFSADHPSVSMRQVSLRLNEITTRDRPACVPGSTKKAGTRAITFYLRPRFYKYLPEKERPADWERYAAADEALSTTEAKSTPGSAASSVVADSSDGAVQPPPQKKMKIQSDSAA